MQEGKALYSNRRRPLLMVVEDPVKRHDLLFAACDIVLKKGWKIKN